MYYSSGELADHSSETVLLKRYILHIGQLQYRTFFVISCKESDMHTFRKKTVNRKVTISSRVLCICVDIKESNSELIYTYFHS